MTRKAITLRTGLAFQTRGQDLGFTLNPKPYTPKDQRLCLVWSAFLECALVGGPLVDGGQPLGELGVGADTKRAGDVFDREAHGNVSRAEVLDKPAQRRSPLMHNVQMPVARRQAEQHLQRCVPILWVLGQFRLHELALPLDVGRSCMAVTQAQNLVCLVAVGCFEIRCLVNPWIRSQQSVLQARAAQGSESKSEHC